jgi:hypothetical protein
VFDVGPLRDGENFVYREFNSVDVCGTNEPRLATLPDCMTTSGSCVESLLYRDGSGD